MVEITKEDCKKLYNDFMYYLHNELDDISCDLFFLFLDLKIIHTINNFEKYDQSELRSMFRTILKVMKKDFSKYMEIAQ